MSADRESALLSRRDALKMGVGGVGGLVVGSSLNGLASVATRAGIPIPSFLTEVRASDTELGFDDLLARVPEFPVLVKDDPQTQFVKNRVPMLLDSCDQRMSLLRSKVIAFSNSKGWGDSMAVLGQWFYPLPIENGAGQTGSDTWAYAVNVLTKDNVSIFMKPGVKGQIWGRLPSKVTQGHVTMAFAVNPNWEFHKTDGNPNVAPAVIVRNIGHATVGAAMPVRVLHAHKDCSRFGAVGHIFPETDNVIVRLVRDGAITMVDFDVVDPHGNQEFMIELGSDDFQGPNFDADINRVRAEDVKQLVPPSCAPGAVSTTPAPSVK